MPIPLKKALKIGNSKIILEEEYENVYQSEITGDETVLKNPFMDIISHRMTFAHNTKNKIAFVSLCSYSRPYNTSPKWKKYLEDIEDVDFIVASNGGVIPQEFWDEPLFLSYHAPARGSWAEGFSREEAIKEGYIEEENLYDRFEGLPPMLSKQEVDELYKRKLLDRLVVFFSHNKYDYVFGDFVVTQRNFEPFIIAMEYLMIKGYIKGYDHPREDIPYEENGRSYPTLREPYYNEMLNKIKKLKEKI